MRNTKHKKSSQWLTFLVLALILALLCPTKVLAVVKARTTDLGTVKVRVVDNVQRLNSEKASLGANYQEPFGEILPPTDVAITEGLTMRGALDKALTTKNIKVYGAANYVSGIGPITSADGTRTVTKLSEFDAGMQSGWMVTLNDWFINAGVNSFVVKDGDVVEFCYTCNLGVDINGDFNNADTYLKALSSSAGSLSPEFNPETKNYTLTLPAATKIIVIPTAANRTNQVIIQSDNETYRRTDEIAVVDKQVITVTCAENTYKITIAIPVDNPDQDRADEVSTLIAAIPAVGQITLADKALIEAVRAAYTALSEAQKALVTNLAKLTTAEITLAQLPGEDMSPPIIIIKNTADQTLSEDLMVTNPSFSFKATAQDEKDGLLSPNVKLNGTALVAGTDGSYTCTLTTGSNTITVIATDAAGNKAEKSLKVELANSVNLAYINSTIDSNKKVVSLVFNMDIVNNKATPEQLKNAVTYAADGLNYTALKQADQVSIVGKTLVVTFNTPLTGTSNKLKLAANSLKDAAGKVMTNEITTEALDAGKIDECFIATAAYGSKYQPDVILLRQFRDHCLLTDPLGKAFVKFYYKNSPPIANFIAHSEGLKVMVRGMLTPLVVIAYLLLHPGMMFVVLAAVTLAVVGLRRRKGNRVEVLSLTAK